MSSEQDERLESELALLQAMYPEQLTYDETAREVKYSSEQGSFHLRLPDGYLLDDLPHVLSAVAGKKDIGGELKKAIKVLSPGEEVLDSIITSFSSLSESTAQEQQALNTEGTVRTTQNSKVESKATIVVYLHHLLNSNKRKQALNPPSPGISGLTKPGYPGVLIFAGPARAVREHVHELKQLNWAAFQVRIESDDTWEFAWQGMKEVEGMGDVVREVGEERREMFMECMKMKG